MRRPEATASPLHETVPSKTARRSSSIIFDMVQTRVPSPLLTQRSILMPRTESRSPASAFLSPSGHDGKLVVHVRPDADRLGHHLEEEGLGQLSVGTPVSGEDAVGVQIRLGRDVRLAHADDAGDDAHGLPVREIAFRIKKFGLGGFRHGFVPFRKSVRR